MTTPRSTFFLNSGLPFLQVHRTISPGEALGMMFKRPPIPQTARTYKFLAPLLSAQFINEATLKPIDIFSLVTLPAPRPRFMAKTRLFSTQIVRLRTEQFR